MSYTELRVEDAALLLRHEVDRLLAGLNRERAVWRQLDRAAESVTCNAAEARGQKTDAKRASYFAIARGSSDEVRVCLRSCIDRGDLTPQNAYKAIGLTYAIGKMLTSLIKRLEPPKQ